MNNGPLGSGTRTNVIDPGTSSLSLHRTASPLCTTRPSESEARDLARSVASRLVTSFRSPKVQQLAFALLGDQSFAAGAIYGLTKNLVVSVYQLGDLFRVLALAEYYDTRHASSFWDRFRHGSILGALPAAEIYGASLLWPDIDRQAREAAEERDALYALVRHAFEQPGEVFDHIKDAQLAKYHRFKACLAQKSIKGNFEAGMLFGELLLDILLIADGVTAIARIATKIPALLRVLPKLRELVPVLREATEAASQGGTVAGRGAEAAAPAAKVARTPSKVAADAAKAAEEPKPVAGPKPIPSYAELKAMAANSLDFSTKPNAAVFWSGDGNMAQAQAWAKANDATTLEQTAGGKVLDDMKLFENMPDKSQAADVWNTASKRFAEGASGDVNVFKEGATQFGSYGERTWWKIEQPALESNPNVTSIIERVAPKGPGSP